MEETIGLLTGGFASLRNIESVSSGLVMVSQRLRGIGEDGEAIDGLAPKIEKSFKEIAGIDISKGNGELRSTFEILSDMARIFPTLTEEQRQFLGEQAIGNRQIRVLNAILQNWSDVENAIQSATESSGSAERENLKYLNSIQGKTQQLASEFQSFSDNLIDSWMLKGVIDTQKGILGLLNLADGAIGKAAAYPAVILGVATALKTFAASNFGSNAKGILSGILKLKIPSFMFLGTLGHSS